MNKSRHQDSGFHNNERINKLVHKCLSEEPLRPESVRAVTDAIMAKTNRLMRRLKMKARKA
jgi:hypothetical protein